MPESSLATKKAQLNQLWQEAVQIERVTGPEKAPVRGVNLRLDLLKAFQATWQTIKVVTKIKLAIATTPDPATVIGIAAEAMSAAQTIYAALVQRMAPIEYVAYATLSKHPEGMTVDELTTAVNQYLDGDPSNEFAWYLGISSDQLRRAREVRNDGDWMNNAIEGLSKLEMVARDGEKIKFKSRNFRWGWEPD